MTASITTERRYPLHDMDSAPVAAQPALAWYEETFGMTPNLARVMASSPALLLAYWQTQNHLLDHSTLTRQEINIVQTAVAHENECQYCVAGHTAFGKTPVFNNTDEELHAVRTRSAFDDPRLDALRDFTIRVIHAQGRVSDTELAAFLDAGFTRAQALDIVACVAAKVMSNYTNQIALTPVDDAFVALTDGLAYKETRATLAA